MALALAPEVMDGGRVSNSCETCAGAVSWLPARSVTPVVITSTVIAPSSYASGVTERV